MSSDSENSIGLALSGGGYRSTLFNLGALWRLNELGILSRLDRITSVSGGSIVAALLGLQWTSLEFDQNGVARNFETAIARPIQSFCSTSVDIRAFIQGVLSPTATTGDYLAAHYDKHLFHGASLQQFPDELEGEGPRFIVYATNYHTGASFRFSRPYLGDYHLGKYPDPELPIATAVAASSAFPPFFAPVRLKLDRAGWLKSEISSNTSEKQLTRPSLVDGGVYDNLGLQGIRNSSSIVLVSDAGKPFSVKSSQWSDWFSQLWRVRDIAMNQVLARRKNELIEAYERKAVQGTYWGIGTNIDDYGSAGNLLTMNNKTLSMAKVRTRLNKFTSEEQGLLVNWGYALSDAALRTYLPSHYNQSAITSFPCADYPLA